MRTTDDVSFYIKQVVKEFLRKAASQGRIFHGGQYNVTSTSRECCSRLQQSRCHAVIKDCLIGRRRHVTAVNGRDVPSTAVDRDRTCTNVGDSLKNLALKACYGRRRNAIFLRLPRRSHTFDRGRRHVTCLPRHVFGQETTTAS